MAPARTTLLEDTRLDLLAKAVLGSELDGAMEALLRVNPGLAAQGPFVAAGTELVVPDFTAGAVLLPSINPWE